MTHLTRVFVSCLLISLISFACSTPAPNSIAESAASPGASPAQKITSEGVVKVAAQRVELPAGGSAEATVRLTIQNGYHVNANPPTFSYLKATALEVSASDGVSLSFVTYPKGLEKKFVFAEKELAVYEGETDLKVTLKSDKAAKKGERSVPARLRIQACDEQVCYPPGSLELTIPVNIN
jgi:DsbC/DsbD-like thiol-disulfide interchange protein